MIRSNTSRFCKRILESEACKRAFGEWFSTFGDLLGALIFPWSCPICSAAATNGPFCPLCRSELLRESALAAQSACPRCALRVGPFADLHGGCSDCRGRSLGFDAAVALGPYEGAIRELCLSLKHEKNAWLAWWLSELLVESRRDALCYLPETACIVPIPLHWWRRWQRGYNQAEALAYGLGRRLHLPVCRPLQRTVATDRLAPQSPTERYNAMRGVFHACASSRLTGRTVLLVDDVLTTGATSGAAARALKRAGAARVVVIVIGRAEKKYS
jgi:ComF family protein